MPFADWLEMPNTVPVKFEDLVGPKGGGDLNTQFETILRLQLILHVPGNVSDFTSKVFDEKSPTFGKGTNRKLFGGI